MADKRKDIKITHTTWYRIMNDKNRYNLNSAEEVIIAYQKVITGLRLKPEFEEIIKKIKGEKK